MRFPEGARGGGKACQKQQKLPPSWHYGMESQLRRTLIVCFEVPLQIHLVLVVVHWTNFCVSGLEHVVFFFSLSLGGDEGKGEAEKVSSSLLWDLLPQILTHFSPFNELCWLFLLPPTFF